MSGLAALLAGHGQAGTYHWRSALEPEEVRRTVERAFSVALSVLGGRSNDRKGAPFTTLLRGEGPPVHGVVELE